MELLLLMFLADLRGLSSPDYKVRSAASADLARWWPLTEPAIRTAERSPDLEARLRAKAARTEGFRRRAGRRLAGDLRFWARACRSWDDTRAFLLIACDERDPKQSLPWLVGMDARLVGSSRDLKLRAAVVRMHDATGWRLGPDGDGILACDPTLLSAGDAEVLGALNVVRFHYRGLPCPGADTIRGHIATVREVEDMAGIKRKR